MPDPAAAPATTTTQYHSSTDGPLADRVWNAPGGTTIVVASGTYRGPLVARSDVAIRSEKGVGSVTIQAAQGAAVAIEGAQSVALSGLVLRGPKHGFGSVIQSYGPTELTVEDCVVTGGRGEGQGGGGIDIQSGLLILKRCRVTHNIALQGGGVRVAGAALAQIHACVFAENRAEGIGGGALFATQSGRVELLNVTFTANAGPHGSAILGGRGGFGGDRKSVV